jgi:tungstate transport system ATP-binding protein
MLRAEALRYEARGRVLLDGVTLGLEAGPPSFIIGPNGAGKSVLLRLLHGLLRPTGGTVRRAAGLREAMLFQKPVLLRRNVARNIGHALGLAGLDDDGRIARSLDAVGLLHLAHRPARRLSGGEQQRVALARALALGPDILFLDEPTASLDPAATRIVEEVIARRAAAGMKVVMTTHDLHQARRLAGEVLFLHRGRLVEQTPAAQFFRDPRSGEARRFLDGGILD